MNVNNILQVHKPGEFPATSVASQMHAIEEIDLGAPMQRILNILDRMQQSLYSLGRAFPLPPVQKRLCENPDAAVQVSSGCRAPG